MAKGDSYEEFVEKFKPKKTTDDCYTPEAVYACIRDYVDEHVFSLAGREVIRPFYPGGDYEHAEYPDNCIVLDNPPFSILSKIIDFYLARGIRFFLFGPQLSLFIYLNRPGVTAVVCSAGITYENGAIVLTGFVTNVWPESPLFVVEPELSRRVNVVCDHLRKKQKKTLRKKIYPPHLVNAAILGKLAAHGVGLTCPRKSGVFVRKLDSGQGVFGSGVLMSERMAAERMAAERMVAERMAAERMAAERMVLSERERELIATLK